MAKKKIGLSFRKFQAEGLVGGTQWYQRQFFREELKKLLLLGDIYGIPKKTLSGFYSQLAWELARELYPEPKKRGRKQKWDEDVLGILAVEIDNLLDPSKPGRGVAWAASGLAKREPWKSFVDGMSSQESSSDPGEVLRTMYYKGRKYAKQYREHFKKCEAGQSHLTWRDTVAIYVKKIEND